MGEQHHVHRLRSRSRLAPAGACPSATTPSPVALAEVPTGVPSPSSGLKGVAAEPLWPRRPFLPRKGRNGQLAPAGSRDRLHSPGVCGFADAGTEVRAGAKVLTDLRDQRRAGDGLHGLVVDGAQQRRRQAMRMTGDPCKQDARVDDDAVQLAVCSEAEAARVWCTALTASTSISSSGTSANASRISARAASPSWLIASSSSSSRSVLPGAPWRSSFSRTSSNSTVAVPGVLMDDILAPGQAFYDYGLAAVNGSGKPHGMRRFQAGPRPQQHPGPPPAGRGWAGLIPSHEHHESTQERPHR